MSFTNEEWTKLFNGFIEALQPDQETRVSVDDSKPAFVRIELVGVRGTSTSVLVKKASVIGESERRIRDIIAVHLAAIGVQVVRPREDIRQAGARPNPDGSMSVAEAQKLRGMLQGRTILPTVSPSLQVQEQPAEEVVLPDETESLLKKLEEEG